MTTVDTRARLRAVTFRYIQLDYITGFEGFEDHMLHRSAFEVGPAASKNLRPHEIHPPSYQSFRMTFLQCLLEFGEGGLVL